MCIMSPTHESLWFQTYCSLTSPAGGRQKFFQISIHQKKGMHLWSQHSQKEVRETIQMNWLIFVSNCSSIWTSLFFISSIFIFAREISLPIVNMVVVLYYFTYSWKISLHLFRVANFGSVARFTFSNSRYNFCKELWYKEGFTPLSCKSCYRYICNYWNKLKDYI